MPYRQMIILSPAGRDVSDEVDLINGKSNPFGWSQHEVHHNGRKIGLLESGSFHPNKELNYTAEVRELSEDEYNAMPEKE